MFYIYIIQNESNKIYVGFSSNLDQRLYDHNRGKSEYTEHKGPWELIYYEVYLSKTDAMRREKTLKHYGSTLGQLKIRIKNSLHKSYV